MRPCSAARDLARNERTRNSAEGMRQVRFALGAPGVATSHASQRAAAPCVRMRLHWEVGARTCLVEDARPQSIPDA